MNHLEIEIISLIFIIILLVALWVNIRIRTDYELKLDEQIEINESLKKEIKFQSNVNKTLRKGLDAITKKNCHVKNI